MTVPVLSKKTNHKAIIKDVHEAVQIHLRSQQREEGDSHDSPRSLQENKPQGYCGRTSCVWECIPIPIAAKDKPSPLGDSPRCKACVERKCQPDLMDCSGLSENEIPQR